MATTIKTSDPRSFTARDMNRKPAQIFEAVRKFGSVDINTRDGDTFVVTLKEKETTTSTPKEPRDFEAHYKRLREMGNKPASPEDMERFNQIIAGEE